LFSRNKPEFLYVKVKSLSPLYPAEENNIARKHPKIVAALRSKLDAHWKPTLAAP
jgi:hypothetical protein